MTVRVACLIYLTCIFAWDWNTNSASWAQIEHRSIAVQAVYSRKMSRFNLCYSWFPLLFFSPVPGRRAIRQPRIRLSVRRDWSGLYLRRICPPVCKRRLDRSGIIGMILRWELPGIVFFLHVSLSLSGYGTIPRHKTRDDGVIYIYRATVNTTSESFSHSDEPNSDAHTSCNQPETTAFR